MTKHIDDFLNIPHTDELDEKTEVVEVKDESNALSIIRSDDTHAKEADVVRNRALELQDEIAEVARNIEPSRSARMFEVSGQHLKIALDASNSKEKAKLEAAKLKIEAAKLGIRDDSISSLDSGDEVMVDRNSLIRQLMAEEKAVIDAKTTETDDKDK